MRLVLDTNTALSGLLWGGTPAKLLDAAIEGRIELISSMPLLAELQGALRITRFFDAIGRKVVCNGRDIGFKGECSP